MESFCGSKLWDLNTTWYTDNPDFTPCFEKTILVWVPAGFLWIFAGFELFRALRSHKINEYKSLLHECVLFFTLLLILLNFARLLYTFVHFIGPSRNEGRKIYPVDYVAPAIKTATLALAFYIRRLNNSKGIRISGTLFSFWTLSVFGGFFEVQTNLRSLPLDMKDDQQVWTLAVLMISFPIEVLLVVLNSFYDGEADQDCVNEENEACPLLRASIPSRIFFQWVWPLLMTGHKKPIAFADVWLLHPENKATTLFDQFQQHWLPEFKRCQKYNKQLQKEEELLALSRGGVQGEADNELLIQANGAKKKPKRKIAGILLPIWKCHWKTYLYGTGFMLIASAANFASPLLLDLLIQHVDSNEHNWKGYFYTALMLIASIVQFLSFGHRVIAMQLIGLRAKNALSGAVYRKSLIISNSARKESTTGEIVNLMSIDSQRFCDLLTFFNYVWVSPLVICVATYYLYRLLGYSVFAGVAILILVVPMTAVIVNLKGKLQEKQMKLKDERVKMVNEILSGIKVLKFYAWETSFENEIRSIREKELNVMRKTAYIDATNEFVWYTAPFVVTLVTFATFVLSDASHILDARKAFVALTLFNMIRNPMNAMPRVVSLLVQTKVSIDRLNKFLNSEEIDPEDVTHLDTADAITIDEATFSWGEKDDDMFDKVILRNISLKVRKGSLVAVVGIVGAGKSSLLSAVLGEMQKLRGNINTSGSIAYVSQQAWIQNATLRGNILFGKPFDDATYNGIVNACALLPDLEILPSGDKTEIGEKGINLSGGQKQRVALARAVYHNADTYLLDDPLSAVDAHVSKQLFEKVIGPEGLLSRKTRVVVTHGLTYLPQMDCIFVMKNGEVSEIGTFQELLKKKGDFAEFLTEHIKPEDLDDLEAEDSVFEQLEDLDGIMESVTSRKRLIAQVSEASDGPSNKSSTGPKNPPVGNKNSLSETEQAKLKNPVDKLIQEEKSEVGNVDRKVFIYYLRSLGLSTIVTTLIFHVTLNGATLASNIWLSIWSMEPSVGNGTQNISKRDMYLSVYGVLGVGQAISVFMAAVSMALGSLSAAKLIHNHMLRRILRSPMLFFDTTPLGRIVNRFSKDTDIADSAFPVNLRAWLNCIFEVLVTVIGICYSTPWILIVFIPIMILYYGIQRFYVATVRQLRRLESVSRSPIYAHFGETLAGTSTIRAFSSESQFIQEVNHKLDSNLMAYYPLLISNRWLDVWLESLANTVILVATLLVVITRPDAGVVGLSLSYALNMLAGFSLLVRCFSLVETNAVAIERLKEYSEVSQEAPWEIASKKPPHDWPQTGAISFENYQTRYREGLDLVLKNVTCTICAGEKVGIVGRTGAGKSSMTLGLFRIIEAAGGSISIDGVDISQLGLHDLRGNLTIIPQDPVLFAGELRANLDPFKKYSDLDIWRALEFAHLKETVNGFSGGLLHEISEGGENLSVGQRQLVCLARALLRKSKILILDEATAAVDLETDDLIQQTIREEFRDNTVLTIAHRLNTIMDYNKVMVLDNGEIVEFDEPKALLENTETIFYGMAKNAGVA